MIEKFADHHEGARGCTDCGVRHVACRSLARMEHKSRKQWAFGSIALVLLGGYAAIEHGSASMSSEPPPPSGLVPQPLVAEPFEMEADAPVESDWLSCFIQARDELLLSDSNALELCRGAISIAPVACFEAAQNQVGLFDEEIIELCRCAVSVEPAACFERGSRQTALTPQELLELCSATTVRNLWPSCTPMAAPVPSYP